MRYLNLSLSLSLSLLLFSAAAASGRRPLKQSELHSFTLACPVQASLSSDSFSSPCVVQQNEKKKQKKTKSNKTKTIKKGERKKENFFFQLPSRGEDRKKKRSKSTTSIIGRVSCWNQHKHTHTHARTDETHHSNLNLNLNSNFFFSHHRIRTFDVDFDFIRLSSYRSSKTKQNKTKQKKVFWLGIVSREEDNVRTATQSSLAQWRHTASCSRILQPSGWTNKANFVSTWVSTTQLYTVQCMSSSSSSSTVGRRTGGHYLLIAWLTPSASAHPFVRFFFNKKKGKKTNTTSRTVQYILRLGRVYLLVEDCVTCDSTVCRKNLSTHFPWRRRRRRRRHRMLRRVRYFQIIWKDRQCHRRQWREGERDTSAP